MQNAAAEGEPAVLIANANGCFPATLAATLTIRLWWRVYCSLSAIRRGLVEGDLGFLLNPHVDLQSSGPQRSGPFSVVARGYAGVTCAVWFIRRPFAAVTGVHGTRRSPLR